MLASRFRLLALLATIFVFTMFAAACGDTETRENASPGSSATTGSSLPPFDPAAATDVGVGQTPPAISAESLLGTGNVAVVPADGPMVVLFGAHWCPHCNEELPLLANYLKNNSLPDGVSVYLVSSNETEGVDNYPADNWLTEMGWPEHIAPTIDDAGDAVMNSWGLSGFPYFVALNSEGEVVERATGNLGADSFHRLLVTIAAS